MRMIGRSSDGSLRAFLPLMKCLSQQLFHDLPADVGEPEIAAHAPVSQTRVFKPQEVKDRGLQIVDVDFVFHNFRIGSMSRAKSTRVFTAGGRRRALTPATFHNAETPAKTRTSKTNLKLRPLRIFASEATRSVRGGNYRSRKRLTLCSRRRRPTQKLSLALSWTTRAPLVDVKRPKPLDLMLVLIAEKLVWLKALKRSPRI